MGFISQVFPNLRTMTARMFCQPSVGRACSSCTRNMGCLRKVELPHLFAHKDKFAPVGQPHICLGKSSKGSNSMHTVEFNKVVCCSHGFYPMWPTGCLCFVEEISIWLHAHPKCNASCFHISSLSEIKNPGHYGLLSLWFAFKGKFLGSCKQIICVDFLPTDNVQGSKAKLQLQNGRAEGEISKLINKVCQPQKGTEMEFSQNCNWYPESFSLEKMSDLEFGVQTITSLLNSLPLPKFCHQLSLHFPTSNWQL